MRLTFIFFFVLYLINYILFNLMTMESTSPIEDAYIDKHEPDIPTLRTIVLPQKISKTVKCTRPIALDMERRVATETHKIKRVITTDTRKWKFSAEELSSPSQNRIVATMDDDDAFSRTSNTRFVAQQMRQKIYGYRSQDIANGIFDAQKFVELEDIVEKCRACRLACFYCHENVMVLYEYVRDPKQWTVERIDNNYGHNHDNFEIACLSCNIRRRTIHFERYLLTKQLRNITRLPEEDTDV